MPIHSKDRLVALKELCLYANSGPRAIKQLQSLYPAKQAAISLESSDSKVIQSALFLADKVLPESPNACHLFQEYNGGEFCLKLLASANEVSRIDALKVFPYLASVPLSGKFALELLVRIAVLLEEGLKVDTPLNKQ